MKSNFEHLWILKGHIPTPCKDVIEWGHWCQTTDRRVAEDRIDNFLISTVFLATNLRVGEGAPILFETVVFQSKSNSILHKYSRKYSTWDEAVAGHQATIVLVKADSQE